MAARSSINATEKKHANHAEPRDAYNNTNLLWGSKSSKRDSYEKTKRLSSISNQDQASGSMKQQSQIIEMENEEDDEIKIAIIA